MTVSTFALGGKSWELPHLPWKVCRIVEPAILGYYKALVEANLAISEVPPQVIANLADAVFGAISHVDKTLTREDFDSLPFGINALAAAIPLLAPAAGLKMVSTDAGGGAKDGQSLGEL